MHARTITLNEAVVADLTTAIERMHFGFADLHAERLLPFVNVFTERFGEATVPCCACSIRNRVWAVRSWERFHHLDGQGADAARPCCDWCTAHWNNVRLSSRPTKRSGSPSPTRICRICRRHSVQSSALSPNQVLLWMRGPTKCFSTAWSEAPASNCGRATEG